MSPTIAHALRVVLLIALLAACITVLPWLLGMTGVVLCVALLAVTILYGNFFHGYLMQATKALGRTKTSDGDKQTMTVVELVVIESPTSYGSTVSSTVYRMSTYKFDGPKMQNSRRVKRRLLGVNVDYLGHHGDGFWFYNHDILRIGKNGLICVEPNSLKTLLHEPKRKLVVSECRGPSVRVEHNRRSVDMDLRESIAAIRAKLPK